MKLIAGLTSAAGIVLICIVVILVCIWKRKKDSKARKEGKELRNSLCVDGDLKE